MTTQSQACIVLKHISPCPFVHSLREARESLTDADEMSYLVTELKYLERTQARAEFIAFVKRGFNF